MGDYQHMGRVVGGIEDWSPPRQPRRRCGSCITLLRAGNPESHCEVCQRKMLNRELAENDLNCMAGARERTHR